MSCNLNPNFVLIFSRHELHRVFNCSMSFVEKFDKFLIGHDSNWFEFTPALLTSAVIGGLYGAFISWIVNCTLIEVIFTFSPCP